MSFSIGPTTLEPSGMATPFWPLTSRTTSAVTGSCKWDVLVLSGVSKRSHSTVPAGRADCCAWPGLWLTPRAAFETEIVRVSAAAKVMATVRLR